MDEQERQLREMIVLLENDHRQRMEPYYKKLAEWIAFQPAPPLMLTREQYRLMQNAIGGDHK